MKKKLYPDEVRKFEVSLKVIEKSMETLKHKKSVLLEKLGRTEAEVVDMEEIEDETGKYKVIGKYYKCQKYKNDGELGNQTRYVEIK